MRTLLLSLFLLFSSTSFAALSGGALTLKEKLEAAEAAGDWQMVLSIAREGQQLSDENEYVVLEFVLAEAKALIQGLSRPAQGIAKLKTHLRNHWDDIPSLAQTLILLSDDKMPQELFTREYVFGTQTAEHLVELIEDYPKEDLKLAFFAQRWSVFPPVAQYFYKAGQYERAVDLQRQALSTLPSEEEGRRSAMKEKFNLYLYSAMKAEENQACPRGLENPSEN